MAKNKPKSVDVLEEIKEKRKQVREAKLVWDVAAANTKELKASHDQLVEDLMHIIDECDQTRMAFPERVTS
jgi:predicted secreted Zn-dependent protease